MAAIFTLLNELLLGSFDLWPLSMPPSVGGLAVLAVLAVGVVLACVAVRAGRVWRLLSGGSSSSVALRRRSACTAPVAVRDPDAPGKPRPRAPSVARAIA